MSEMINQCTGMVTMADSAGTPVALLNWPYYYTTSDWRHLAIRPAGPLTKGETYTVTISGIVTSGATPVSPSAGLVDETEGGVVSRGTVLNLKV
jgi:hypothetical protein